MQCVKCGATLGRDALVLRNLNGTPRPVSFCCYEHYVAFWKGVDRFAPLPEFKKVEQ